jgi:multidrug resistance efflux pump
MEEHLPEILSEEVHDIMSTPPKSIIRWGITIMFFILSVLLFGSWFIKYPDTITAPVTITSNNFPVSIIARSNGKITHLFVKNGEEVYNEQILGVIENPAQFNDIILLDSIVKSFNINNDTSLLSIVSLQNLLLGDIQQEFQVFQKECNDYYQFISFNLLEKKTRALEKQLELTKSYYNQQISLSKMHQQEVRISNKEFCRDSILYSNKVISAANFDESEKSYLKQKQNYMSFNSNLIRIQMEIAQLEQEIIENKISNQEKKQTFIKSLELAKSSLTNSINTWKKNYLLISPTKGILSFTTIRETNQNVNMGDMVFTIVPQEQTSIKGIIQLPMQGAGKVKKGQSVNIKINNYPYMEYGMVRARVKSISLVPVESNYILEIYFPEGLQTNYDIKLEVIEQMTGSAEIITEDIRLLERFFNPIRSIIKNKI